MLKKLLTLAAVFLLFSCGGKSKSDSQDSFKIEEQAMDSQNAPYQTLADEQQAAALNAQADAVKEIEVQDRVLFSYDSSDLTDDAKKILDTQVAWLKSDSGIKVTIEGHCDERGTREYNIALGERRANSAKNYLVTGGIDASRIKILSYGKERPAFFGTSEDVMSKNRRAVTVIN